MKQGTCNQCRRERGILARGMCSSCYSSWHRTANGRKLTTYTITCERCGEHATVQKRTARFCTQTCKARHLAGWSTSTAIELWVAPPKPKRAPPPTPRRTSWWRFIVQGSCSRCGDQFTVLGANPLSLATYCSSRCARAHGKDRRRATKRDAFVANVNRLAIYERDNWTCQLCRKKVDRTKKVPHPKAPTIDHIVPLGAGGTHEPVNAQCAHFLCNSIKGDRGTDQLRLIG